MARKLRISLEAKMCLLMVGILCLVVLCVGHIAMSEYRTALMDEKTEAFDAMAHSLSLNTRHLLAGDDDVLTAVSAKAQCSISELVYVVIADNNGKILFSKTGNGAKTSNPGQGSLSSTVRRIANEQGIEPRNMYTVTTTIDMADGQTGQFMAGFELSKVTQTVSNVQSKVITYTFIILLIGVLTALGWGRRISRGLRSLIKASQAVSEGNLTYRIENKAKDEIGQLADSFNFMVETLEANQQQLVARANTDCATGLYNHRYFQERLKVETIRACRYERSLTLLMIDIDFFKNFNDDQGHPAGDAALKDVAQILMENIRQTDIAARYGGEEFAVILPETEADEAILIAERIKQAVAEHVFQGRHNTDQNLTVSIGAANCPEHADDRAGLIMAADMALYQAKETGRNRVCMYDLMSFSTPQSDPCKLYVLLSAHDLTTIEALADAVDAKLKLPDGHSRSVGRVASETAQKLGLSEAECSSIYIAALLRDIGQIVVPDKTIEKPGELTAEEKAEISKHPSLGYAIVQKAPHLSMILPALLHHHERYDGTGYPSKVTGEDIPISARIISASDAYHSMLAARPYRKRKSTNQAQQELLEKSSTQFDPNVVQAMLEVLQTTEEDEKAA